MVSFVRRTAPPSSGTYIKIKISSKYLSRPTSKNFKNINYNIRLKKNRAITFPRVRLQLEQDCVIMPFVLRNLI